MTGVQPPAWATQVPSAPVQLPPGKAASSTLTQLSTQQVQAMQQQLLQAIWQGFLQIVDGFLLPDTAASDQLAAWWASLQGDLTSISAALQQSWLSFQQLIQGVVQVADADVAALVTYLTTFGTDASNAWTELQNFFATGDWSDLSAAFTDLLQGIFGGPTTPAVVGSISAPSVSNTPTSAQPVSNFPNGASMQPGGGWSWDSTVSFSGSGGSAKFVASATVGGMRGVVVPVQAGQVVALSAQLQWSGLTTSGANPIQLQLIPWNGSTPGTPVEVAQIASPASSGSWTLLTGNYTVPSSGVSAVQMRLLVTANATTGSIWWSACTTTISGGYLPTLRDDTDTILGSFAPGGTSAEFVTGVTNLLALVGLTPADVGGATNLTALWTAIIVDFINPLNAIEQSAISGLTALWNSIFGTPAPTTSSLLQPAAVANVLGGASLGADVSSVHTATTVAAAAATTAGTNASIAIASAGAANTLAQGTIDGLNTAWSAGGTGNPVTTIPTIAAAIPTSAIVGGTGAAVTFGAVGAGATTTGAGSSLSVSETHSILSTDLGVLAFVSYLAATAGGTTWSTAVTYGGTAMTQIGPPQATAAFSGGASEFIEVWWLKSPPTGAKTVTATVTHAGGPSGNVVALALNSVSYLASKVASINAFTGSGTTPISMTGSSATDHMLVGSFGVGNSASPMVQSAFNQTSRWSVVYDTNVGAMIGDAAGASSLTFSETINSPSTTKWVGYLVDLSN